ncbi:toprim domain-containing protein [Bacillus sp. XF8]|uniref:toprim domain-containing protein n=1 Tax=Bacillus sp. XF8 TaxID=2819289 RepID=UPI001AA0493F|nr:toprim domain-containing protein [Bacillus sp. XF8]MBO1582671.1 toprim domain-containing protein [Bacillus sp. XF8]
MATIKIRDQGVNIDIEYELRQFSWTNERWSSDKLIAASPFRYEHTPSFFVNLDGDYAGTWKDSGAFDSEWESGNFTRLLSYLRNETYEETEDYLLEAYGVEYSYDNLTLKPPKLRIDNGHSPLDFGRLQEYAFRHPYLGERGISEVVQRQTKIGYDRFRQAVVIPWFDTNGRLANIKYRKTRGKAFWYEKDGKPIGDLIYGLHLAYKRNIRRAVYCEAEIDAMSFMTAGVFGLANGGSSFNQRKAELILKSPIEELVIVADNDPAGEKLRKELEKYLNGKIQLTNGYINEYNDANEALVKEGVDSLRSVIDNAEPVRLNLLYVNSRSDGRREDAKPSR